MSDERADLVTGGEMARFGGDFGFVRGDGEWFWNYEGTLSFPRDIIAACPLVNRGDAASIYIPGFFGLGKGKTEIGEFAFRSLTTSGVSVTGNGTLFLNSNGGSFPVTSLTIGDPAGEHCTFENLDINAGCSSTNRMVITGRSKRPPAIPSFNMPFI